MPLMQCQVVQIFWSRLVISKPFFNGPTMLSDLFTKNWLLGVQLNCRWMFNMPETCPNLIIWNRHTLYVSFMSEALPKVLCQAYLHFIFHFLWFLNVSGAASTWFFDLTATCLSSVLKHGRYSSPAYFWEDHKASIFISMDGHQAGKPLLCYSSCSTIHTLLLRPIFIH